MFWLPFVLLADLSAAGSISIPTKEIAPGVRMPVISIDLRGDRGAESYGLNAAVEWLVLGGRGLDEAQIFRNQHLLPRTLQTAGLQRKEVFITSKIAGCDHAKQNVEKVLHELQTDYIDLLMISMPHGNCTDAWSILEEYHMRGAARAIGLCQFRKVDLEDLLKTAKVIPAVNQIRVNAINHDDDLINYMHQHNILVQAFSPLGNWVLRGYSLPRNPTVKTIAQAHNVSTYQIGVRWILQRGWILKLKAAKKEQMESDVDVFSFALSDAEMLMLDALQKPRRATGV